MPQLDHLRLVRAREPISRRKTGGGAAPPARAGRHGGGLRREAETAVATQRAARPAAFVDPSLLLRVQLEGHVPETEWERLELRVVSSDEDRTVLLFSSTGDITEFLARFDAFDAPIPQGQAGRSYAGLVGRIDSVGALAPRDRFGPKIKAEGFSEATDLQDGERYLLDVELWEFASPARRRAKAEDIERFLLDQDGAVYDIYVGPSLTVMRVEAFGRALRPLLDVPEVASLDLPPEPDLEVGAMVQLDLGAAPQVLAASADAPVIGVLDSGINDHPMLEGLIAGRLEGVGIGDTADIWGHGTKVAGTALFGDLGESIRYGQAAPVGRVVAAKVVNDQGRFPDRKTVPTMMRETIQRMHAEHGCRLFVMSLGDVHANLPRGRVGPWATTLDDLARELDVLFFVSTGNRIPRPRGGPAAEEAVTVYPRYLLEPENRLAEPAGAANVVTVGAMAGGTGLDARHMHDAHVRPITQERGEPSPFTRTGPGAGGIRKPDFIDLGGTLVFDAPSASLRGAPELPATGVVTLNHRFVEQLFTSARGTSFAAPMLAHKAARLLQRMPHASANLLRALLVGAARQPEEFTRRLAEFSAAEQACIGGAGLVDVARAAYSDDHRVVLFAEGALEPDQFAVYKVPIPAEFRSGGRRTIRVSLAFDPPVRRTRQDYLGARLEFRLLRGCDEAEVFEHFRERNRALEGDPPQIENRFKDNLSPGPTERGGASLQSASVTYSRDTDQYGEEYHLVVRSLSGWAADQYFDQRFAVVVELEHQPAVRIYNRIRERVRV
ncbi:MAG: S8 family peptidase [Pseudomonadota bacterium]